MIQEKMLYAVNEKGERLDFKVRRENNILKLTLPLESFKTAKKVLLLGALSKAHANDDGYYILPRCITMSGDPKIDFKPGKDETFSYGIPVVSFYGIKKPDCCLLVRLQRDYRFQYEVTRQDNVYTVTPFVDFTVIDSDRPYKDVELEIIELAQSGDYNDMAAAERNRRLALSEIRPLRQKFLKDARLAASSEEALIRIRMAWKESPSPILHQTPETEPEMLIACDFECVCRIADALKAKGVRSAELQLVGWNIGGHDGRFPQLFPADERLGGNEGFKKAIDHVKKLGYRISTHTNLIDSVEIADTFTFDDAAKDRENEPQQKGHYSGGLAYHVCPKRQLKNYKRDMPELLKYGENGLHFIDVLSIVEPDVCFDKDHPCTTKEGVSLMQEIAGLCKKEFGGFSSEGCFDFVLDQLDYGLYISIGEFGTSQSPLITDQLPVFELAYHGIVLYNPSSQTINYTVKSPEDRLHFIMQGGIPTFYFHSRFKADPKDNWMGKEDLTCKTDAEIEAAAKAIKEGMDLYEPLKSLQQEYMVRYEKLSDGVQIATYENGTRVVGNMSDRTQSFEGKTLPPFGWTIL